MDRAALRRDRERLLAREVRGLHARGAVPDLPGHPAQARDPGRHRRAAARSPSCAALSIGDARRLAARAASSTDREKLIGERVLKEINARLGFLRRRRPALPVARPRRGDAGRRRGAAHPAGHPDRLRPGRRALRPRRAVDRAAPARQPPADRDPGPAASDLGNTLIVVEHDEDTIRTADWVVDIGPQAGEHGGQIVVSGTVEDLLDAPTTRSPAPTCPGRRRSRCPPMRRPRAAGPRARRRGRARAQPAQRRRRVPARLLRRGHRRQRLGQVDAGQRHPLRLAGQQDQRRQAAAGPAQAGHAASTSSTRSSASTSRRSAARRGRTRPPTPASSTTSASCSPRRPRPRSAATSRAGSRSTSRAAAARTAPATARSRSR